jgi:hypothetical protein
LVAVALIAALVLPHAQALAAPSAPVKKAGAGEDDEATKLKKQGDQAMLDLHYDDALAAYEKSYALKQNPALHYNRGRAFEALGRWADALDAYERFLRDAPAELRARVPTLADHVVEIRKRVTTLTLNVSTSGARVLLRDAVVGTSPLAGPLRVNAGKAKLEVSADGYETYVKELDLPGGEATTIDVALKAKTTGGTLVIRCEPAALVTLDGKPAGSAPLEQNVVAGSHTITLTKDGYVTRTATVVVEDGGRKETSFSLEREEGITSKWWFWTGVGVVAVGGAALTYGLLTSRDAGKGDIAPGRVTAPLFRFP